MMTTHVFVVDEITFRCHLKYLFAGTGAKDKDVDFNGTPTSTLYPPKKYAAEAGLVAMMSDCSRLRGGDLVLFYLRSGSGRDGMFFGVFQVVGDPFLERTGINQYLLSELNKNLTFRVRIAPYMVFPRGITEWQALDEIRNLTSPNQMLWSLIYRKLRGNRGNTMITIYETERIVDLLRRENGNRTLGISVAYDFVNGEIVPMSTSSCYTGMMTPFDILPRLIQKHSARKAYEAHLQMYIVQNIGRNPSIDNALGISDNVEWIGNEVACGVGMQRIDIMVSKSDGPLDRVVMPIELKAVPADESNITQISRYVDWVEQYYVPNRISAIQPVLICSSGGLTASMKNRIISFNQAANGRYLPLRYIEYDVINNSLIFTNISY